MSAEQYPNLLRHINYIFDAHQKLAKKDENTVRGDNETPYSIHPVWCSMMIATETSLSREIRIEGTIVLLYHDVSEDTNASLPNDLSPEIIQSISDMTFMGGMKEEMVEIWSKSQKIRLFKLYDKVSNLLDASWMPPDYLPKYVGHTKRLLDDVEKHYGSLNIVKIAHSIVD